MTANPETLLQPYKDEDKNGDGDRDGVSYTMSIYDLKDTIQERLNLHSDATMETLLRIEEEVGKKTDKESE